MERQLELEVNMDKKTISTSELVEELKTREGVKVIEAEPHNGYMVGGTGPAIVLVVED